MTRLKGIWDFSVGFVHYCCLGQILQEYVGTIKRCKGPSMLPTLNQENDFLLENTFSINFAKDKKTLDLQRGDVVIATSPEQPNVYVCKRVMGLPGDRVYKFHGFSGHSDILNDGSMVVPRGHVWLLGDNPANSNDSRNYGPVPLGLVRSKVVARIWPLTQINLIPNEIPPQIAEV
eukprot:m.113715 g.113715  ORF g.113715 m.113715 type:complete len:176 (+) comp14145_c1_seq1:122-649(+)